MGVRIRFLVSAEEIEGTWSLIEYTAPPHFAGPAPHYHANTTELFYVLEGQLTVDAAGEVRVLGPGDLALVQPGTSHRFSNASDEPCRFLVQASPAGLENYFPAVAQLIKDAPSWPPADMRPVVELAQRFDTFMPP